MTSNAESKIELPSQFSRNYGFSGVAGPLIGCLAQHASMPSKRDNF